MGVEHQRLLQRRHAAWWTLAAGLAVTAAVGWEMHREAVEMDRQRLLMRASEIQSQLDSRLEKSEMLLQHLRDYLMLSGENRNAVFARWCYQNGLTINCPWILGVAVATNRNEVNLRATLPNPSTIWTEADWQTLWNLAKETPIECHLALCSNLTDGKQFLPDYDLRCMRSDYDPSKPITDRTWLAGAILGARPNMSERQVVMWNTNRNPIVGTSYYVPVYRPAVADYLAVEVRTRAFHQGARWLHLSAVIVAPVDFRRLVDAIRDGTPADLEIELFSSTNQTKSAWLSNQRGTPRAADPEFKAYLTHRQTWPMYGQRFSIFFYTTPLFEAQSPRRLAKTAVAAGLAVTLLASALVGVSVRARNRQDGLTQQIREARDALAAAQREREKFSRDLHDGTIQSLYAIQLGLGHTVEKIEAAPAHARRELSAVRREMDTVIAEIRQFITAGAEAEQAVDFCAVLHALAQRARGGTTARIELHCDPEASARLTGDQAVQLANIAREALSNALRHGKPQRVEIRLRSEPEAVVLEVADDGAGFEPAQAPPAGTGRAGIPARPASVFDASSAGADQRSRRADWKVRPPGPAEPTPAVANQRGVGLASMLARAQELGGTLTVDSSPGRGTRVVVRLTVGPEAPATEP